MSTVEKKSIPRCECPNTKSARDVIVITIETCCRRTCEGAEKEKAHPKHKEEKALPSPEPKSKSETEDEALKSSEPEPETEPEPEPEPQPEPETPPKPESETDNSESALEKFKPEEKIRTQQRVLKLPLLVERHHGPGCAMEISVLEKHEDTCSYKKEEGEGRNAEDRVGSYECIGRMVFRTCNSTDVDTDSSGITGPTTSASLSPTKISKPHVGPQPLPPSSSAPEQSSRKSSSPPQREASAASTPSVYESIKSKEPSPMSTSSVHSPDGSAFVSAYEEPATAEKKEPVEASRGKKDSRHHDSHAHVMMATSRTYPEVNTLQKRGKSGEKKHYPGDDCKLHSRNAPRGPLLLPTGQFEKIYASKKVFPVYADESNQTDLNSGDEMSRRFRGSLGETITSLSDLSKSAEKKKAGFLGSLFRKGATKPSHSKRSKK